MMNKISIDITSAITPGLFGIDHKITFANRKHYSGWICTGNGLAAWKLSVS